PLPEPGAERKPHAALLRLKTPVRTTFGVGMLIVRKSRIQGAGLYTDAPIRGRKKIGEYTGERISLAQAKKRIKGQKRITIVELSEKEAIDGSVNGGPFQFMNHSCAPNVFTRIA